MKIKVLVILNLFILSIVLFQITNTYSRYVSAAEGTITLEIAKPIVKSGIESLDVMLGEFNPGETKTYNFSITNFIDDDHINDVSMYYHFEITNTNNLPVKYELYKNNDTSRNLLNSNNISSVNLLNHTEKQTDSYSLKITFIDDVSCGYNYEYNNLIDGLFINVISEQVVNNEK